MSALEEAAQPPLLILEAKKGFRAIPWREVVEYRDLLATLATRDIKLRYRQTAVGVVWVVLQPLMAAGIFTFVFGTVAGIKLADPHLPFFIFTFAGTILWNLFSQTVQRCSDVMITNSGLVSKIYFPRIVLPLSVLGGVFLDFAVSSVVLVGLCVAYGIWPGMALLWAPWSIVVAILLALGIGMGAAALNVSYRDVRYVIPVILQFLTFASPLGWPADTLTGRRRLFATLNPMSPVLEMFRYGTLGYPTRFAGGVIAVSVFAIVVFYAGAVIFSRSERRFADII